MKTGRLFVTIPDAVDIEVKAFSGSIEDAEGIHGPSLLMGYIQALYDTGSIDAETMDRLIEGGVAGMMERMAERETLGGPCPVCGHEALTCGNVNRMQLGERYNPRTDGFQCSLCGRVSVLYEPRFCPNCGAAVDTGKTSPPPHPSPGVPGDIARQKRYKR